MSRQGKHKIAVLLRAAAQQSKLLLSHKFLVLMPATATLGILALVSVLFTSADTASNTYAANLGNQITTEVDGQYYVTLTAPDVNFSVSPSKNENAAKQRIDVGVETNVAGGAKLYLSMAGTSNSLHLNGDTTQSSPVIAAVSDGTDASSFPANTWGYSTDDQTYSAVPTTASDPALLANVDGETTGTTSGSIISASIPVYYAANVDTSIPSGSYSNRMTYSAVVDGGITTEATLTSIKVDGQEVEELSPHHKNDIVVTTNLMVNPYGTPRVYYETTNPTGYAECNDVVVSSNSDGYMIIQCSVTPGRGGTGVTLHITPKGSENDIFCIDGTYPINSSQCEAGDWKWGEFTVSLPNIVATISSILYMQDMTPEVCANSITDESARLIDNRDNKKYWVSKLADGNCWMTQSLDLDLQAGVELTPSNTDVDDNWDPEATTFTRGSDGAENNNLVQSWDMGMAVWKTPDSLNSCTPTDNLYNSSCSAIWQNVSDESLWSPLENIDADGSPVDSSTHTYDAHYLAGNHYSYLAATAGTGGSASNNYTIATGSICPKGWELPTSGNRFNATSGSFYNLFEYYGINTSSTGPMDINLAPFYFVRAGNIRPTHNLNLAGSNAVYYSSVAYSSTQSYYMNGSGGAYGRAVLDASSWHSRWLGFTVRCVATSS